ncbi:hypothetical protein, partial [Morganella sp. GD04133]|uniref:hypothetical protein n=1 Tax=Morganella sp. GD04133 TaxID=2975435 RepID=UPI00244A6D0B
KSAANSGHVGAVSFRNLTMLVFMTAEKIYFPLHHDPLRRIAKFTRTPLFKIRWFHNQGSFVSLVTFSC